MVGDRGVVNDKFVIGIHRSVKDDVVKGLLADGIVRNDGEGTSCHRKIPGLVVCSGGLGLFSSFLLHPNDRAIARMTSSSLNTLIFNSV